MKKGTLNTDKMEEGYKNKPMYNIWLKLRMSDYTVPFDEFNKLYGPARPDMRFSNKQLKWVSHSEHRRNADKSPKSKNKYKGVAEKVTKNGTVYWYAHYKQKMIKGSTNYISAEDCNRLREVWVATNYPAV